MIDGVADRGLWLGLTRALNEMAEIGSGRILYVPNVGNAGDALIATGTWQFFDDIGLRPRIARLYQVRRGDVVIYAGGGNLVPEYRGCARFLKHCLSVGVARALVLPHTIRGHQELLSRLDSRFTLVCRDHESSHWVARASPQARHVFAPDLALWIRADSLLREPEGARSLVRSLAALPPSLQVLRYLRWRQRIRRLTPDQDGTLRVGRTDVERTAELVGSPEHDLSGLYGSHYRVREEFDAVSRDFLRVLTRARHVVTNRLHVGIGAALLGKEVTLHDNSNGTIRAVYDASLASWSKVHFVGKSKLAERAFWLPSRRYGLRFGSSIEESEAFGLAGRQPAGKA